ncbi:hypothetical protein FCG41_01165 [Azotobacter chroococcum]|nr:hypothetical protein FCG41_01165 [Azotobacter chroococcum]
MPLGSSRRSSQALVAGAELTLHGGQKVGLTGRQRCPGKSTLFALLRGEFARARRSTTSNAGRMHDGDASCGASSAS